MFATSNRDDDENSNANEDGFEPTWTYIPYDAKKAAAEKQKQQQQQQRRRRKFSTWTIPTTVAIPEEKLQFSFVRSSGAGGQNVNKVNTKVELRVHVLDDLTFVPHEVRQRVLEQNSNRINKDGYLSITSQEARTQIQNRKSVLSKLEALILQAYPRPKERKQRKGISKASKERNKKNKRHRSELKSGRKRVTDW